MKRPDRAARRRTGLTLIEVLVGTVVVGLVVVSASWALSGASTNRHLHRESPINAALLAKEIHELALTLPTVGSGHGPATTPAELLALDTLDGAVFTPPITSAKQTLAANRTWKQSASLSTYAMSDLAHPVSDSFVPAAKSSSSLYKLDVNICNGGVDMGTWSWWLNP